MLEIDFLNKVERAILNGIHVAEKVVMKFMRSLCKLKIDTISMRQCSPLSIHVAAFILENLKGIKFITGSIET